MIKVTWLAGLGKNRAGAEVAAQLFQTLNLVPFSHTTVPQSFCILLPSQELVYVMYSPYLGITAWISRIQPVELSDMCSDTRTAYNAGMMCNMVHWR